MISRDQSLSSKTTEQRPVFSDPGGRRSHTVRNALLTVLVLGLIWVGFFSYSILSAPTNTVGTETRSTVSAAPSSPLSANQVQRNFEQVLNPEAQVIAASATAAPTGGCGPSEEPVGTAMAALPGTPGFQVMAFLPNEPIESFLSLQRNCVDIDVLVPDWFEIRKGDFGVIATERDAELENTVAQIRQDTRSAPMLLPLVTLAYDADLGVFAASLAEPEFRSRLVGDLTRALRVSDAVGLCLQLGILPASSTPSVTAFMIELSAALRPYQAASCLVTAFDDPLLKVDGVIEATDRVIVSVFDTPWRGSVPGPLAAADWFETTVAELNSDIGAEKLVISIGNFAYDWVSGRPLPERLSFATAMTRIADSEAVFELSTPVLNSYASFVDTMGHRHQIWMLDAASAYNSLAFLKEQGLSSVAISALGEEDPGLWRVIGQFEAPTGDFADDLRDVVLPDYVEYSGAGSFYRLVSAAEPGVRTITRDARADRITEQRFSLPPRPFAMERYGEAEPGQVALTFDDGPNEEATSAILDALKEEGVPATFFVVGRAAMRTPDLLRRMVAEGHTIGSHTFFHPRINEVSEVRARSEMNALQSLVQGITGKEVTLFRPPYVRGPGPLTGNEAASFALLEEEGYLVAGSDIVPPDWAGLRPPFIVDFTMDRLAGGDGSVIVMHDGRSEGVYTAEAVPLLIQTLRANGYEIVSLATLLGMTDAEVMPDADWTASGFNFLSFGALGAMDKLIVGAFWMILLAGLSRSILFLILAQLREPHKGGFQSSLPSVTIVIPAYNEEVVILRSVRNALSVDYPNLKVMVVDDGSTDRTLRLVQEAYGDHESVIILTQPNQGKWRALNHAYEVLDTEIAVCVDADTNIDPGAIRHMVQPFSDPTVGAVAGTVLVGNKKGLLTRLQAFEYFVSQNIGRRALERINGIIVIPGALGAWRAEAVRDVGLYSNETLTEDADLTIWMLRGGYKMAYAEHALAYTEVPAHAGAFLKQRLRWSLGNLQVLWKHKGAFGETARLRLFSLFDLGFFGYIAPLIAPLVDLMFLVLAIQAGAAYISGDWAYLPQIPKYAVFALIAIPLLDLFVGLAAFRFDRRESFKLLLVVPFLNLYFRQLLYISVYRALWSALSGKLAGWNKLKRFGLAASSAET
ncbi:MAG: glycosyltransferase [Flavimaricola sp.]|nr:glycosyltransferase [Flavimaricola sp.]